MGGWFDHLVTAGIVFLLAATPLAFGAVHAWAFASAIVLVVTLVLAWAAKVALLGSPHGGHRLAPSAVVVPLALLLVLGLVQLAPLPARVLHLVSPAAHELYATSLPGWPDAPPYADLATSGPDDGRARTAGWQLLPTADEVRTANQEPRVAAALREDLTQLRERLPEATGGTAARLWRPLSLAPPATRALLVKVSAYVILFLLVALYPFNRSPEGDWRALRTVLIGIVATGSVVAALGLLQRATWNGHLLWFFVPHDWAAGPDPRPQTNGPFVSRNSFAGYLVLVLPLAVSGALCRTQLDIPGRVGASRAFFVAAASVIALGIVMSLSRGGWLAAFVAVAVLVLVLVRLPRAQRPWLLRSRLRALGMTLALAVALGALVLAPLDAARPNDVDARLAATVSDTTSIVSRVAYWRASLAMLRDFPIFGAGLGAWPDLFPRYDEGPYSVLAPREAHNDYLQLAAETGMAGTALLAVALLAFAMRVRAGLAERSPRRAPVVAAVVAGLTGLAVHEALDFDLQIPAIAFLAAVLAGIALRAAPAATWTPAPRLRMLACGGAVAAALVLGVLATRLAATAAASEAGAPSTVADALRRIDARPARAGSHLALYYLLERGLPDAARARELEIATWLEPQSPFARDALAVDLAQRGRRADALALIEESVYVAPEAEPHFYLRPRLAPYLAADEVAAIERGLGRARDAGRAAAAVTHAALYADRGRYADAARAWAEAAAAAQDRARRFVLTREAGIAALSAGQAARAEELLREAVALRPYDTSAQARLIEALAARSASFDEMREVVRQGARDGADAYRLQVAVADAARRRGDQAARVAALEEAVQARPSDAEVQLQLGLAYLAAQRFERALLALRRAAEIDPTTPSVWYYVGRAEAARYDLVAAERALTQAVAFAPDNEKARQTLDQVRGELAALGVR